MIWAHIRLAMNHLPALLVPVAIAMLTAAWAKNNRERPWMLATIFPVALLAAALMARMANLSGWISPTEIRDPAATTVRPPT